MASISSVRDGLKTRLATITDVRAHDTVPATIVTPAAVVKRQVTNYDSTMARGSDEFEFVATLIVAKASDRVAQDKLDDYLAGSGDLSVKAAVEGDKTLGGAAHTVRVTTAGEEYFPEYNGIEYLAVDFMIEVIASGA